MMNNITPVVKNLLLLNIVIFIGLQIASQQSNLAYIYGDYFSLHKPDNFLRHDYPKVEVEGKEFYYPENMRIPLQNGGVLTVDNVKSYVLASPKLGKQLAGKLDFLRTDKFKPLQIITHFFSHSLDSLFHIIFNMFVLFSFGPILETVMGAKRFLAFYLFCGVVGGILVAVLDPSIIPVVGASGAIFGVMVAFAMYFPKQKLNIMFIPIGFEARKFIPAIGVISLVFVVLDYFGVDAGGGISHFGHLAGMIAAVLFFYGEKFMPFSLK